MDKVLATHSMEENRLPRRKKRYCLGNQRLQKKQKYSECMALIERVIVPDSEVKERCKIQELYQGVLEEGVAGNGLKLKREDSINIGSMLLESDVLHIILDHLSLSSGISLLKVSKVLYYNEIGAKWAFNIGEEYKKDYESIIKVESNPIWRRAENITLAKRLLSYSTHDGCVDANASDLVYRHPELFN